MRFGKHPWKVTNWNPLRTSVTLLKLLSAPAWNVSETPYNTPGIPLKLSRMPLETSEIPYNTSETPMKPHKTF